MRQKNTYVITLRNIPEVGCIAVVCIVAALWILHRIVGQKSVLDTWVVTVIQKEVYFVKTRPSKSVCAVDQKSLF